MMGGLIDELGIFKIKLFEFFYDSHEDAKTGGGDRTTVAGTMACPFYGLRKKS